MHHIRDASADSCEVCGVEFARPTSWACCRYQLLVPAGRPLHSADTSLMSGWHRICVQAVSCCFSQHPCMPRGLHETSRQNNVLYSGQHCAHNSAGSACFDASSRDSASGDCASLPVMNGENLRAVCRLGHAACQTLPTTYRLLLLHDPDRSQSSKHRHTPTSTERSPGFGACEDLRPHIGSLISLRGTKGDSMDGTGSTSTCKWAD